MADGFSAAALINSMNKEEKLKIGAANDEIDEDVTIEDDLARKDSVNKGERRKREGILMITNTIDMKHITLKTVVLLYFLIYDDYLYLTADMPF